RPARNASGRQLHDRAGRRHQRGLRHAQGGDPARRGRQGRVPGPCCQRDRHLWAQRAERGKSIMTALALSQPVSTEAASLRKLGEALATPREQIESTFLTVGARLAEGAAMLNRVTKVFEALPAELQSPELVEASTRLADVGQQAKTISAMFATEQVDLERLVTVVAAAEHPIAVLRQTVKMMGIVAINARVVAASVVGDSDDFDVFTTDIAKLSESATSTIQAFTTVYRRLSDEVGQAARQRGRSENTHADTLDQLATDMDMALEELARQRAVSA